MTTREVMAKWQVSTLEWKFHIFRNEGLVCCTAATCMRCWYGLHGRVAVLAYCSRAQKQSQNMMMHKMREIRMKAAYLSHGRMFNS